jgi:thioredoxin-dependent peroxiredoxin
MKKLLLSSLLASAIATSAFAALPTGTTAPDFQAEAALAGKTFNYRLQDALKKGIAVVYFYPSAYTGGCNIQAHSFSENSDKFAAAGASIIGVSLDNIARLKEFSADPEYCAGKIAVAADADGKIAQSYELNVKEAVAGIKDSRGSAIDHGFAERTTFIVAQNGKIVATIGGLTPAENVAKTLEAVQKLAVSK